ncbi:MULTISPECIES: MaoC/PaaZ C-terminal domain-containing protein [unclassified Caballeronia]|uniref:MaoC/PaaZ C-terminal domain-containing protein n=1 Tax=unclassified Caballeronia TaxID=2646786 RepID=UPI00285BED31|nr:MULTISPECIES: MaoC/PaaZ C-terminal domain-containing protein [unclassified Caballeronia]MDR5777165.1 MaoC/PaaZ C-terminal domain-containing protein [Caballeronia sp. LZ002]MDR5852610.1 MaoC/PaaZ C-terminal domain-containing protein [Caballeronia sp. LZ003]
MLNYTICKSWPFEPVTQAFTERDTILYALSLGCGQSADTARALPYVYERKLEAIPSMACVLGSAGMWWSAPETGVDWRAIVHGQQDLHLFAPLPVSGRVEAMHKVVAIADKGAGRGAVAVVQRDLYHSGTREPMARSFSTTMLRGDGGFSAADGRSDALPEALPALPDREATIHATYSIAPDAALLYRLLGDLNPLHVDPEAARAAGFDRPILHGLCTYGMAARAALEHLPGAHARTLRRIAARFTAPIWPGETVRFEFWPDVAKVGRFQFRAQVDARGSRVLDHGLIEFNG